jgi:hypothetical protein
MFLLRHAQTGGEPAHAAAHHDAVKIRQSTPLVDMVTGW